MGLRDCRPFALLLGTILLGSTACEQMPLDEGIPDVLQPVGTILRPRVTGTYHVPGVPLATMQNAVLPGTVANDRGMVLGGVGSDLWRRSTDPPGEYWLITDRGPNGQIRVDGVNRRTFPIPEYAPSIYRVRTEGNAIRILETLPIVGQSGRSVTGLSNDRARDEIPYDYSATIELATNPSGLDTEGLVRTSDGEFWLVEEYSPSIVRVAQNGQVRARYVPQGVRLDGADYPVVSALPGIYEKRRGNRGFEGVALSQDERLLYVALQSPLLNPDSASGQRSRNTRILVFDTVQARPVAEYVYRFQPSREYNFPNNPDEMKLSAVVALGNNRLLVLERTDDIAKVFLVDLSNATNILGSSWDDPTTRPTLEQLDDPATAGVTALPKSLIIDLSTLRETPKKIEGLAVIDSQTIAIVNDNDYDIGSFDARGNNVGAGEGTRLLTIRLTQPLP